MYQWHYYTFTHAPNYEHTKNKRTVIFNYCRLSQTPTPSVIDTFIIIAQTTRTFFRTTISHTRSTRGVYLPLPLARLLADTCRNAHTHTRYQINILRRALDYALASDTKKMNRLQCGTHAHNAGTNPWYDRYDERRLRDWRWSTRRAHISAVIVAVVGDSGSKNGERVCSALSRHSLSRWVNYLGAARSADPADSAMSVGVAVAGAWARCVTMLCVTMRRRAELCIWKCRWIICCTSVLRYCGFRN